MAEDLQVKLEDIASGENPWKDFENFLYEIRQGGVTHEALSAALGIAQKRQQLALGELEQTERGKDVAWAGSRLIRKMTKEAIEIAENGGDFNQIRQNLLDCLYWYFALSATPGELSSEKVTLDLKNEIVRYLFSQTDDLSPEADKIIERINRKVDGVKKGVLTEFYCYCLFSKLGFRVKQVTNQDDFRGIDLYVDGLPIQVKSNPGRTYGGLIGINFNPRGQFINCILVDVDIRRVRTESEFSKNLFSLEQPADTFRIKYKDTVDDLTERFNTVADKYRQFSPGV